MRHLPGIRSRFVEVWIRRLPCVLAVASLLLTLALTTVPVGGLAAEALEASNAATPDPASPGTRPNLVWIVVDDLSPDLACYGQRTIATPNLDRLAAEGVRFEAAFTTGPICSISRSALVTGCYQTHLGCQNHRSGNARHPITLPEGMTIVPRMLREAGYHVNNLSIDDFLKPGGAVGVAKTDYNFSWDRAGTYDTRHWAERPAGTPFFAQVQLHGGKHRGERPGTQWPAKVRSALGSTTPTNAFELPPILPEDPVIREDWAQYLDTVRYTDHEVGRLLDRLRQAGELERTVVVFLGDHGISHVRHKQFLYDGGLRIPLIIRGPGVPRGTVRRDLVEHIDLAPTALRLAGLPIPHWMQARPLFGAAGSREFAFAARDRADETVDRIRSVRSRRFKYLRNYYPSRPYRQPNRYMDDKAIVQALRRWHAAGALTPAQARVMAGSRPREELYDLEADPFEVTNLADDPRWTAELRRHRAALAAWQERTGDRGRDPEPEAVYLSYVRDDRPEGGGSAQRRGTFEANVDMMLRWSVERPMDRWEPERP
jgi:arylsulfatase A-like enzyme